MLIWVIFYVKVYVTQEGMASNYQSYTNMGAMLWSMCWTCVCRERDGHKQVIVFVCVYVCHNALDSIIAEVVCIGTKLTVLILCLQPL